MTSNELAVPSPNYMPEGLEDFDPNTDMVMPQLKIGSGDNDAGFFIDSLSGERYSSLEVVFLGLTKQRVLWPAEMGSDAEPPICRSYEFTMGHPDPENPARFPWKTSGFPAPNMGDAAPALKCEDCGLKEWGTDPKGGKAPWCAEQHVYAVMLPTSDGGWTPATLTMQRSSMAASKAYATSFARTRTPMFMVTTKMTLTVQKRGQVTYSVPVLTRGGPTDPELHDEFISTFRRIRSFLQTPRSGEEVEVVAQPVNTPTVAPQPAAAEPAPVAPQPAPTPAPAPVAEPAPQPAAAPVAAQPQPVAVPTDVAPPAVAPVDAAPAPQPAPAPVAAPAQPAAATLTDDELPF